MPRLSPCSLAAPTDLTLCQQLRASTRDLHDRVEAQIGLPGSIQSRSSYVACLRQFHRLYRPVYAGLAAFPEWSWVSASAPRNLASKLAFDLATLEPDVPLPTDAPGQACPELPRFGHALGALYVLEGATLGGAVILRQLRMVRRAGVEDASVFFGAVDVAVWQDVRSVIERFGRVRPNEVDSVISGARRTFAAIGDWMEQSRWCTQ